MSASKALLSFSKNIIVDVSETAGLPDLIKNSYRTGGASIPIVIITDPAIQKIYGRFDHPAMKSQKYDLLFKDLKADISEAQNQGTFFSGQNAPKILKVANGTLQNWQSSAGTQIKAKLIGIEDDSIYLFETEAGKTIRATAQQLAPESVTKARQSAGLN